MSSHPIVTRLLSLADECDLRARSAYLRGDDEALRLNRATRDALDEAAAKAMAITPQPEE